MEAVPGAVGSFRGRGGRRGGRGGSKSRGGSYNGSRASVPRYDVKVSDFIKPTPPPQARIPTEKVLVLDREQLAELSRIVNRFFATPDLQFGDAIVQSETVFVSLSEAGTIKSLQQVTKDTLSVLLVQISCCQMFVIRTRESRKTTAWLRRVELAPFCAFGLD